MLKKYKKDIYNILILFSIFLFIYIVITIPGNVFGSTKDWDCQHWVFPEYFRILFYKNHNLFPDIAMNIGGGQNIYNFSYYGLFSPIILLSFLLPFISMRTYIICSTIFMYLLSIVIMYFFILSKSNRKVSFMSTFFFMMASPLIFHLHRHIMFVNYMPFLLLGYVGVDRYFKYNKKSLIIIDVLLMILTSYYFSVSGIVSIIIYGVYVYLSRIDKFKIKNFFIDGFKFIIPILVGVLSSSILIIPTLYCLFVGRSAGNPLDVLSLMPGANLSYLLYSTYTMGLPLICLFSLFENLMDGKKEDKFLSIVFLAILIVPIFIYILNGTLYVEAKVLITFIPLMIILLYKTLLRIENKIDINLKLLSKVFLFFICLGLFKNHNYALIYLVDLTILLFGLYQLKKSNNINNLLVLYMPFLIFVTICFNFGEMYVPRNEIDLNSKKIEKIQELDNSFYRIGIYEKGLRRLNNIYNLDHYTSSIYSSSSNNGYKEFYYLIGNEYSRRSTGMLSTPNNIFYNIYMGNKYIISDNNRLESSFYKVIDKDIYLYDKVYSLGYSTDKLMSKKDFDKLSQVDKIYAITKYIIVDEDVSSDYKPIFEKINLDYELVDSNVSISKENGKTIIDFTENKELKYGVINYKINSILDNKTLVVIINNSYSNPCSIGDNSIKVNGIKNKLSCDGWKYHNGNFDFIYVLSGSKENLNIILEKGRYEIDNISFYALDNSYIYSLSDDKSMMEVDTNKTKGNKIYGTIDSKKSGYMNLSIPYDHGFKIYVDNKEVQVEKTDLNFIGFKIEKGKHDIYIEYNAPLKKVSLIVSIIGIIILLIYLIIDLIKDYKYIINNEEIMSLYQKYREIIVYLIVGVLTTVVSLVSYYLLRIIINNYQVCTVLSWICAVLFAYITNRKFVFESKNNDIIKEFSSFVGSRIFTLFFEMFFMFVTVKLIRINDRIAKLVVQVFITVFNYLLSKLLVFKK